MREPAPPPGLTALTLGLLGVVLLRVLVPVSPEIWWDADPLARGQGLVNIMLGPAAGGWLDVGAMLLAAGILGAHGRAGGRIRRIPFGLWAVAGLFCLGHALWMPQPPGRAVHWLAASTVGLAAMHLARHRGLARLVLGVLVALLVPLFMEILAFRWFEHELTVEQFREQEAAFLEARGWERGSDAHQLYVRRLETPSATGAFGMSNVLGSLIAALAGAAGAVAIGWFARRRPGRAGLGLGLLAIGTLGVAWTHSLGAMIGLASGLAFAAVLVLAAGRPRLGRWMAVLAPVLALGLVAGAFLGVLGRGAIGPPETVAGERTLLFRFHYLQGAWRILVEEPLGAILRGTGPEGFKARYTAHKPALNPEEVVSTHNVFADYFLMLGVGGLALGALLVEALWRAARGAVLAMGDLAAPARPREETRARELLPVALVGLLLFGGAGFIRFPGLLPETFLLGVIGACGFVLLAAVWITPGMRWEGATCAGLLVASLVLLVHNQVEMFFFHPGAVMVGWLVLGAAGGAGDAAIEAKAEEGPPRGWFGRFGDGGGGGGGGWGSVLAVVACGLVAALFVVFPVTRQEALKREAAEARVAGKPAEAMARLDAAAAVGIADFNLLRWRVILRLERAHEAQAKAGALAHFREALGLLDAAWEKGLPPARVLALRARLLRAGAERLDRPAWRGRAIEALERLVEAHDPHGLTHRLWLADLLWDAGRREAARAHYRAALASSERYYLDPARQLAGDELERAKARARD